MIGAPNTCSTIQIPIRCFVFDTRVPRMVDNLGQISHFLPL